MLHCTGLFGLCGRSGRSGRSGHSGKNCAAITICYVRTMSDVSADSEHVQKTDFSKNDIGENDCVKAFFFVFGHS